MTSQLTGTLRDVLVPRNEIVHPRDEPTGGGVFVGLEHIEPGTGRRVGSLPIRLEDLTGRKARFHPNDIVYGYLRPYLNKVWVADFDGYSSVDQYVFEVDGAVPEYVAAFLRSPEFLAKAPVSETPGQLPRIRLDEILAVPIVLPSVEDQGRIAAQLAAQLATVEDARNAAGVRSTSVDDLRIRVLRKYIPLPPQGPWPWVKLDTAAEFLDGRRRPVSLSDRTSRIRGLDPVELVPYFGANGQAGWIDDHLFDESLVLLAEDGGAFGSSRTPIAYRIDGKAWVNNHAHVLRPRPGVDVDYLGFALAIRPDIGEVISGSTRGKLNRSVAGAVEIPLPPFDQQVQIATELQDRLTIVVGLDTSVRVERQGIDALPAALLRRAFEHRAA